MDDAVKDLYLKLLYRINVFRVRQYSNIIELQQRTKTFHEDLGGLWKENLFIFNYSIEDDKIITDFKYQMKRPE